MGKAKHSPSTTLYKLNNFLTVVIIIIALYILLWPFYPMITLQAQKTFGNASGYTYKTRLHSSSQSAAKPIPQDNRLVIPSLLLDESIHEGKSIAAINKGGTWHRPNSSDPTKNSNTVIAGHRFTYNGAATFYSLDTLKPGDDIIVYWQGKEYDYIVDKIKTVGPHTTSIEAPTDTPTLTLFTCTPLWSAKNRLVVTATPRGIHE